MAFDLIPTDVRQFIVEKIDSIAELEGLLLFRRNPETVWNIEQLAQNLYINQRQAEDVVNHLCSHGFLVAETGEGEAFQYQPASPELAEMVERIAETYSTFLIPVTNLIHSKPKTKVQQFADAFKFRNKEEK